jgi:hypothetical protein
MKNRTIVGGFRLFQMQRRTILRSTCGWKSPKMRICGSNNISYVLVNSHHRPRLFIKCNRCGKLTRA